MQKVHLLGIGGAGMAGMATMLREMGMSVTGYDREESDTLKRLQQTGIPITLQEDSHLLHEADCCVYSAAIPQNHPQLQWARQHLPTFSRGEMLGRLTREFRQVLGVAGTHGKTTVCGMLTHILLAAGQDPSVLMGGHLPILGGNGRLASRQTLVCEACEFAGSFLHSKRDIGILLNVDNDHLEYYGTMENLKQAFADFLAPCQTAIVCRQDEAAMELSRNHPNRLCYGLQEDAHCFADQRESRRGYESFTLHLPNEAPTKITLQVPGRHNLLNALAAATAAWQIGVSVTAIQKGLQQFTGVARRFETICQTQDLTVVDDYAHHPTEIAAVLKTAGEMGFGQITAIFQPFTYSRTLALHREFAEALASAQRVILPPIMAGREPENPQVTSGLIAAHLPQAVVCQNLTHAARLAVQTAGQDHLILTLGCGNVYRCGQQIRHLVAPIESPKI